MEKPDLVHLIHDAFPTADPPTGNQIVRGASGEAGDVRAMLSGKHWTTLNNDALLEQNSALGFLTDEAFRYYIPAYMLLLLHDLDGADILASSVIRHLTLPVEVDTLLLANFIAQSGNTTEGLTKFLQEQLRLSSSRAGAFVLRMRGFNSQQGQAINEFLKFLGQHHADYYDEGEPDIARTRYWFQYET